MIKYMIYHHAIYQLLKLQNQDKFSYIIIIILLMSLQHFHLLSKNIEDIVKITRIS